MKTLLAATLIIMGFGVIVNASRSKSLSDLIEEARAKGEPRTASGKIVEIDGVKNGLPGKALEIEEKETTDGLTHDFYVYFENEKPVTTVFMTIKDGLKKSEFMTFSCDAKGNMSRCNRLVGTNDEKGNPVRGTEQTTTLNSKRKEATAALRHELDFWLKGKYRKTAAAAAKATRKQAASIGLSLEKLH